MIKISEETKPEHKIADKKEKNEEINEESKEEAPFNELNDDFKEKFKERSKLSKALYSIAGTICLALGIIGIVLPILPTTPFLLLSAACYSRSSEKFYNWLLNNRIFGSYIRNYREGKGMSVKSKIFSISMLWITILVSILFFITIIWVQIILLIIATCVSTHLASIRPKDRPLKGLPGKPKMAIISIVWIFTLITIFFLIESLWINILLLLIASSITTYIGPLKPSKSH